jgi:hypothetical protein
MTGESKNVCSVSKHETLAPVVAKVISNVKVILTGYVTITEYLKLFII